MAPHAEEVGSVSIAPSKMISRPRSSEQVHVMAASTDIQTDILPVRSNKAIIRNRFSHNDVAAHRARPDAAKFSKGLAPFSSATMFKSPGALSQPSATKSFYESHLSREGKARKASSLKGALKYFNADTISLCGGLPSSEYFPFESIDIQVPIPQTNFSSASNATPTMRAGKHDITGGTSEFDLNVALNYGQSMGPPQIIRFLTEHTEIVHGPIPYNNWEICMTQGSTSALDIAVRMLCERGDSLLAEEYAFSSALESILPMGIVPIGIKMDSEGMCPSDLNHVLERWDTLSKTKYHGAPKPKVLYTVPTGHNPTGATQSEIRRRKILEICDRHNIFILEDEPYYFLQMEEYCENSSHTNEAAPINGNYRPTRLPPTAAKLNEENSTQSQPQQASNEITEFLDSLVPSYLKLSSSGNVLRMDSFSKILAPGARTGWVTGPANIIERFVRACEVSAQSPSGISMIALFKLLEEGWGHEGFLKWLMQLRKHYTIRRDGIVQACHKFLGSGQLRSIVRFDAPTAGMFHWLNIDVSRHPRYLEKINSCATEQEQRALLIDIEEEIFVTGTKHDVLIARGSWFRAEKDNPEYMKGGVLSTKGASDNGKPNLPSLIYFRMTFAAAPLDRITEAVRRFSEALKLEFGL